MYVSATLALSATAEQTLVSVCRRYHPAYVSERRPADVAELLVFAEILARRNGPGPSVPVHLIAELATPTSIDELLDLAEVIA